VAKIIIVLGDVCKLNQLQLLVQNISFVQLGQW
jgi:hypothetical protein